MVALGRPQASGLITACPLHHSPPSTSDQRGPEVIINFVRIVASLSVPVRDR
jgi:hypothetical protein